MSSYEYARVNVFTEGRFGGNPLAVLTDARGLTDTRMQAIAREFNLSETAFVLPPDNPRHHARVRIFTPTQELPFAGHPNVGTGFVLARAMDNPPEHLVFEEIAGLVRVHILRDQAHRITGTRISAPRPLSIGDAVPIETVAIRCSRRSAPNSLSPRSRTWRRYRARPRISPGSMRRGDSRQSRRLAVSPVSRCCFTSAVTVMRRACVPECLVRSVVSWRTPRRAAPAPRWPGC
jgi:hypothetical protein